jgi:tRNA threonylcarbamoyladenosine biosynthesis protein TsaB
MCESVRILAMKLLAIDTATDTCSAALWIDGEVRERFEIAPQRQSELILPMMDALLAEAGLRPAALDALAFGRGPGSFTGVRIATGVVQGVALAADLPVVLVSTLAALAQGHLRATGCRRVLAAYDARMGEVYWAACEADDEGIMRVVGDELVVPAHAVPLADGTGWHGAGSGWAVHAEVLGRRLDARVTQIDPEARCHAQDVARIGASDCGAGRAVPAERALPVYLRDRIAWKSAVSSG